MGRHGKLFATIGLSVVLAMGCVPAAAMAEVSELANDQAVETSVLSDDVVNEGVNENTNENANEGVNEGSEGEGVNEGAEAEDEIVPTDAIESFVYRLYKIVLNRSPELDGFLYQTNAMRNGAGAAEVARNFLISNEFSNRKELSNEDRIKIIYKTLLNRECNSDEDLQYWVDYFRVGMSCDGIAKSFCESGEFIQNCAEWGVNRGNLTVAEPRDLNYHVTAYAHDLYRISLNREPDVDGLNFQVQSLLDGIPAACIIYHFVSSEEFTNRELSLEDQVEIVYQSMLGRGSDEEGLSYWMSRLDVGMSACAVVVGFSNSGEFKNVAAAHMVNPETITADLPRDMNYEVTRYVYNLYDKVLDRSAASDELDYWCNFLFDGGGAIDECAITFTCDEFVNGVGAELTNEELVKLVYLAMFDREADEEGLAYHLGLLEDGTYEDLEALINTLGDSDEFTARCDLMGVRAHHKLTVEELIAILDAYSVGNGFVVFGTKKQLSQARYDAIIDALNAFYYAGKEVGFTMIDLNTGVGISYNSDISFSSACSVKGPYTIALNQYDPSSLSRYQSLMYPALSVSDNGTYTSYFYAEGTWPIDQYISRGHVTSFRWTGWTAYYTAEDLARMWVCSAEYLLSDTSYNCEWLKSVLSSNSATMSRNAALRYGIGTVYAKSGWHDTARTEGALVMDGDYPYVTGIMSTANINYSELVTNLAAAIYEAHDELVRG